MQSLVMTRVRVVKPRKFTDLESVGVVIERRREPALPCGAGAGIEPGCGLAIAPLRHQPPGSSSSTRKPPEDADPSETLPP